MAKGEGSMRKGINTEKVAIVTTSWDDGHPLDIRVAQLLSKYGLSGTFYVPLKYKRFPIITEGQMRALRAMGMEIGSHTLTHPNLSRLRKDQALNELEESKKILEDILMEPITAFAYPKGKHNLAVRSLISETGYKLARTTVAFRTDIGFDPFCMHVSFQFFPTQRLNSIRHALREANLMGLTNWLRLWKMETNLLRLSELLLAHILKNGGILHLWGHSWEIEEFHLWGVLEETLSRIANLQEVLYLANSQVLDLVHQ
jgi:hypothetical protein